MKSKTTERILALVVLASVASGAAAEKWITTGNAHGDPLKFTNANGRELGVWGWSVSRTYSNGSITYGSIAGAADAMGYSSGIGVKKNSSAYHTLGNNNRDHFDGILLNFGPKQEALSALTVTSHDGWSGKSHDNDRDVQIWKWTGAQPWSDNAFAFNHSNHYPSGNYPGTGADVWGTKWAKVGDYYNQNGDGTITFDVNPDHHVSSAWLVLAKPDRHDTAIKIGAIHTKTPDNQVSVPGTLFLLGIGAIAIRRRYAKPS